MVSRSSRRPRTRWLGRVGRDVGRVLLVAGAVSGIGIVAGQASLLAGAGVWAARMLHAGVLVMLAAPFAGLVWLVPALRRSDPTGAAFALGTLLVSLIGVLLALAAG